MFQFAVNSILVALVSILQTTNVFNIEGIKPNLALVLLLVIGIYEEKWPRRIILIFISMLFLKLSVYPDISIIVFGSLSALGIGIIDYLPWRKELNGIIALGAIFIIQIIFGYPMAVVGWEFIYNFIFGALFVLISMIITQNRYAKK